MRIGQHHRNAQDSELAGAVLIGQTIETIQGRVLLLFNECGALTDEELRGRYLARWGAIEKNALEPRRYELVQQGKLRRTDRRRPGKSGVGRIVWALVDQDEQLRLLP